MEGRSGKKRPAEPLHAVGLEVVEDNEQDDNAGAALNRLEGKAAEVGGRGGDDQSVFVEEADDDEEAELDMKVERFFQIMKRIRVMKESWKMARKMPCDDSAPSTQEDPHPPPWTPMFCWEDFAPASSIGSKGNQTAVAAEPKEHADAAVADCKHRYGIANIHDHRQRDGYDVDVAADDTAQHNGRYHIVAPGDRRTGRTEGSTGPRPLDCRGGGAGQGQGEAAAGSGSYGVGGRGISDCVASLELKLALRI